MFTSRMGIALTAILAAGLASAGCIDHDAQDGQDETGSDQTDKGGTRVAMQAPCGATTVLGDPAAPSGTAETSFKYDEGLLVREQTIGADGAASIRTIAYDNKRKTREEFEENDGSGNASGANRRVVTYEYDEQGHEVKSIARDRSGITVTTSTVYADGLIKSVTQAASNSDLTGNCNYTWELGASDGEPLIATLQCDGTLTERSGTEQYIRSAQVPGGMQLTFRNNAKLIEEFGWIEEIGMVMQSSRFSRGDGPELTLVHQMVRRVEDNKGYRVTMERSGDVGKPDTAKLTRFRYTCGE